MRMRCERPDGSANEVPEGCEKYDGLGGRMARGCERKRKNDEKRAAGEN